MQQVWRPSPATAWRDQADGGLRLNAGGYGFGLRVWQSCEWSHVVAHSGGLPGFGSHMRWLPEHGVAVIALGNLTYTSWGRVTDEVLARLGKTGALQPRLPKPSAALLAARDDVSTLVNGWDDGLADRIAADNLYLDESKARRRASLAALNAAHGTCRVIPDRCEVENALRGTWLMACDRGWLQVSVTLAPTEPPRVQYWTVMPLAMLPEPRRSAPTFCRE